MDKSFQFSGPPFSSWVSGEIGGESLFTSVSPGHRRARAWVSLVRGVANASALFPWSTHLSSAYLPKRTPENLHQRRAGMQTYEPDYKEFSGGFLRCLSFPDHVRFYKSKARRDKASVRVLVRLLQLQNYSLLFFLLLGPYFHCRSMKIRLSVL